MAIAKHEKSIADIKLQIEQMREPMDDMFAQH